MATKDRNTVVGVFTDYTHAEQTIEELRSSGFTSDQISCFLRTGPCRADSPRSAGR